MDARYGPQYSGDDPFKAAARWHQSTFRLDHLGCTEWRSYGNRLGSADARQGRNFYPWPGILKRVDERFGMGDKKLTFDMLASDHLPFNFFVPLQAASDDTSAVVAILAGEPVASVEGIHMEWAPRPRADFLDDHTAFDVYIEYRGESGSRGALGIELKFTEGEYSWGRTERARMADPQSPYHRVHRAAGLYREGAEPSLATRTLKQFWRNQLLGERMVQAVHRGRTRFRSVLVYPAGNRHFVGAAAAYAEQLLPDQQHRFAAIPFASFFDALDACLPSPAHKDWIAYLRRRYLVPPLPSGLASGG